MMVPEAAWWLLVGHMFADTAFQSEHMCWLKRPQEERSTTLMGPWWFWMAAHGIINGAMVAFILNIWWLGPLEALHHGFTDYGKCRGWWGFWADQVSHAVAKGVWIVIWMGGR